MNSALVRLAPIAALAGSLLLGTAGCAATGPAHGAGRPLTEQERAYLADTEDLLLQRCMRRHGYEVFLTDPPADPAHDLPFGNASTAFAREHGLGLGNVNMAAFRENNRNIRYVKGLPEKRRAGYGAAMDGNLEDPISVKLPGGVQVSASTTGCIAEAAEKLYGDFPAWFRTRTLVDHLPSEYMPKVMADKRYKTALRGWADCMRYRGYPVGNPTKLRQRFSPKAGENAPVAREPSAAEVRAALAEAGCSRETGLTKVGRDLERTYQEQVYAAHRELIEDYQAMSVAALERADALRANGSPDSNPSTGPRLRPGENRER